MTINPTPDHVVCDLLTGEAIIVTGEGEARTETRAVFIPYAALVAMHEARRRAVGERREG